MHYFFLLKASATRAITARTTRTKIAILTVNSEPEPKNESPGINGVDESGDEGGANGADGDGEGELCPLDPPELPELPELPEPLEGVAVMIKL